MSMTRVDDACTYYCTGHSNTEDFKHLKMVNVLLDMSVWWCSYVYILKSGRCCGIARPVGRRNCNNVYMYLYHGSSEVALDIEKADSLERRDDGPCRV